MDRAKFFASARSALFGGKLTQGQVDGITAILDAWQASQMTGFTVVGLYAGHRLPRNGQNYAADCRI